jgi:hypothetical protein
VLLQCFRAVQSYSSLGIYACQLLTCLCLPACPGATQCISTAQQWSVTATLCQLPPPLTCTTQGTRSQKYAPVWATTGNGFLRAYQHSTGAAAPAACCTSDSLLTFVPTGRLLAAAHHRVALRLRAESAELKALATNSGKPSSSVSVICTTAHIHVNSADKNASITQVRAAHVKHNACGTQGVIGASNTDSVLQTDTASTGPGMPAQAGSGKYMD